MNKETIKIIVEIVILLVLVIYINNKNKSLKNQLLQLRSEFEDFKTSVAKYIQFLNSTLASRGILQVRDEKRPDKKVTFREPPQHHEYDPSEDGTNGPSLRNQQNVERKYPIPPAREEPSNDSQYTTLDHDDKSNLSSNQSKIEQELKEELKELDPPRASNEQSTVNTTVLPVGNPHAHDKPLPTVNDSHAHDRPLEHLSNADVNKLIEKHNTSRSNTQIENR
jgi:hypothetical protein